MRLVNYGPGEIADRLTILALKIVAGEEAGKDVKHFRDERNALLVKLNAQKNVDCLEELIELGAINARIWQTEDELRRWRSPTSGAITATDADTIRKLAFRAQELNDRRAELIAKVNREAGEYFGAEKV